MKYFIFKKKTIKQFSKLNFELKNEISNMKKENDTKNEIINEYKEKYKNYKAQLKIKKNNNNDKIKQQIEVPSTLTTKNKAPNNSELNTLNKRNPKLISMKTLTDKRKETIYDVNTLLYLESNNYYSNLRSNFHGNLIDNDNQSLNNFLFGHISILDYNQEMIDKIFSCERFVYIQELLNNFNYFKSCIHHMDNLKLDEFYFSIVSIFNDYKFSMILFSKINILLNHQHFFSEKVKLNMIFQKISEIVCQILECDNCTLFILDNAKKELWSRTGKDFDTFYTVQLGEDIAGYVAQKKTYINLEDAKFDPRFNQELDSKTKSKIKSVLCLPVNDINSKEVIGVIQASNKSSKTGKFDKNDEKICEILCKMICPQLKQSMEYSDFDNYEYKLQKLLNTIHKFYLEDNIEKLISSCAQILMTLFTTENVQIVYLIPENNQFNKYFNKSFLNVDIYQGIIGFVFKSKSQFFCISAYNNDYFNPRLDINTSLPLITVPIIDKTNDMVLAILQIEYQISKHRLREMVDPKIDSVDQDIISLLSVNIASSLSLLRLKVKSQDV